ncbi:replicative DNA helicase [Candidatus Gracilibacteria bacterium GN02-873]|nr:replicative DNA helicase [Candidatus Gracilibacteria bacterium GN02-873]
MALTIPPHSIEAEKGVLGSILIDKDAMLHVANLLASDDFYDPAHSIVYGAMQELYASNRPIDSITVREIVDDQKKLESIGGNQFLAELMTSVFSSANIFQYAQIVKNKSVLRKLIRAGNEIIMHGYDEVSDTSELLEKSEKALFGVTQTFIQNKLVPIREILNNRYEEFAAIHADPELVQRNMISTGYKSFDEKLGGFKRGDLIIVAARPSMGKTAIALNFAQNVAKKNRHVAIFSLEMSKEQLTDRLIAAAMAVDSWKLQKGKLTEDEFARMGDALETLSHSKIYLDDSPAGEGLTSIKSKARRLKMESGLDLIVIDYLQLMSNGNSLNRVQEVSEISRGLKSLARELDVPVIALSQLSRQLESRPDKRPVMSDLRESGSIEQDADIIAMLYRDDYYNEFSETPGVTNVLIRKNRNGPIGQVDLKFEKSQQKFYEIERTADAVDFVEEF